MTMILMSPMDPLKFLMLKTEVKIVMKRLELKIASLFLI